MKTLTSLYNAALIRHICVLYKRNSLIHVTESSLSTQPAASAQVCPARRAEAGLDLVFVAKQM